jgi:Rrf2 family protein
MEILLEGLEERTMSANSRLTLAVHALTLIAKNQDLQGFITSERVAQSVNTNPVTLRGLLGMMEKHGLVCVQRGSNAGWRLARKPEEISLLDIHHAVKPEPLFALHHTPPNLRCEVGCSISSVLEEVYADTQRAMEQELAHTTIADVLHRTLTTTSVKHDQACKSSSPTT